jgi:small subunit ribosomal protein S21
MIIVEVKNANSIESALKTYKFKVYRTKQNEILKNRQEYVKPSVKKRSQKNKAIHIQKNKN